MVQKRNIPYESDIMSPYEDEVCFPANTDNMIKEAVNELGTARGELKQVLEKRYAMKEEAIWNTLEDAQKNLGNAIIKLKQVV